MKFCKDCKHFTDVRSEISVITLRCNAGVDVVFGTATIADAYFMRNGGSCGPDGKMFKPAETP
jgi:hypothetical protein